METIINLQLVKEQLRLLGHDVADEVILEFVKGLNQGPAGEWCAFALSSTAAEVHDVPVLLQADETVLMLTLRLCASAGQNSAGNNNNTASASAASTCNDDAGANKDTSKAAVPNAQQGKASWKSHADADAPPSQVQQAPDQQSPKRSVATAGAARDSPPGPSILQQRNALDQRCRNFLARCSEQPSPPHKLQHQQQLDQPQRVQQPLLYKVPQLQPRTAAAGESDDQDSLSTSSSSELALCSAAAKQYGTASHQRMGHGQVTADPRLTGAATHAQRQQQPWQRYQQQQLQAPHDLSEDLDGAGDGYDSSSDSGYSSAGLEAEGSKFLLHQAATMQRVRARLTAKMAGYTAAAAAAAEASRQQPRQPAAAAAAGKASAAVEPTHSAAARLRDASSSSANGAQHPPAAVDEQQVRNDLPRFGFRPGYKPVGVHMPPPPSTAAVEAMAAARAMRQQTAGAGAAAASLHMGSGSQQSLDLPLHMQAASQLQMEQIAHKKFRPEPVLLSAGGASSSSSNGGLHLGGSPSSKAACAGAVAARSSASIIGGDTPPCMAAAGSKTR